MVLLQPILGSIDLAGHGERGGGRGEERGRTGFFFHSTVTVPGSIDR